MITAEGRGAQEKAVDPVLLSQAEAARLLNVSEQHVWRLRKRGDLRTVKFGARAMVPRAAIEELINGK